MKASARLVAYVLLAFLIVGTPLEFRACADDCEWCSASNNAAIGSSENSQSDEKRAGSVQNNAANDTRDQERHRELGHHAEPNDGSQRQPPALISGLQHANGHPRRQHPPQIVEGDILEQVPET